MFSQITIIAPGLLGASLAKVIKAKQLAKNVVIWARRPETRAACLKEDWCDAVFETPEEAVKKADFIILCPPVSVIHPLLEAIIPHVEKGTILTDVGSTKQAICNSAKKVANDRFEFIGSHPMAGSDKSGMEFADEKLFEKGTCFVTPQDNSQEAIDTVSKFWETVGMNVSIATPEEHDTIVAHVSHLPHLTAVSLCSLLAKKGNEWKEHSGPGLKDTTRVAGGSPDMWLDIIEQNKKPILDVIASLKTELSELEGFIKNNSREDIEKMLHRARDFRRSCD